MEYNDVSTSATWLFMKDETGKKRSDAVFSFFLCLQATNKTRKIKGNAASPVFFMPQN